MEPGRRRPYDVAPAQTGPDADEEIAEAEDLSSLAGRIQNQRFQPDDEAKTKRQGLPALHSYGRNRKGLADGRLNSVSQSRKTSGFTKPRQGFQLHGREAIFAGLRPQPIRQQARGRRQRISPGQPTERDPVKPGVEITLQGRGGELGRDPLHMKGKIGGSRCLHEQFGATAHTLNEIQPALEQETSFLGGRGSRAHDRVAEADGSRMIVVR